MPARRQPDRSDRLIEERLTSNGVTFVFHDDPLPFDQVDLERSLHNQARYEEIDESLVERYAVSIENGEQFPPVVVNRRSARSKLVMVDGNHRMHAALRTGANSWPFGWYEINVPGQLFAVLAMEANTRHGQPTDIPLRVRQAVYMIDNGATKEQAAARLAIPVKEIDKRLSRLKIERRAIASGISMQLWEKIGMPNKIKLNGVFTDEGFVEAAQLVQKAALTNAETADLVTAVNATRSGAQQRRIVKDFERQYADRIRETAGGTLTSQTSRRGQTPRSRLFSVMTILGGLEDLTTLSESIGSEERAEVAQRARHEGERLIQLAEKLSTES